jgi:branched-chain amino acid transport system permease protein/urea transport system permease protein
MDSATTLILNALTLISILALVALGLAIIYGLMNVINLAHGEFVTIGAYTLVMVQQLGGSFWLALIVAPITGFLIGSFIEVALIRRLYARPIATILATWGLSLILQQVIQLYFGPAPQRVVEPFVGAVDVLGASYPAYRLFLIAAAIAVFLLVALVFRFTSFGLDIRAVIQNSRMAESLGVDASSVYRNAFGLGAALAALAGVLIAPLTVVVAQMGVNYLARSFFVVIIGGVGSLGGVLAGSGVVGGFETLLGYWIPVTVAQALVLGFAIVLMRFRPSGLAPA